MPSPLDILIPFTFGLILFLWAQADSDRRGDPFPLTGVSWIFSFAPKYVPGYLIWSRGWRGLGFLVLYGLGLFILANAAMHAGGYLLFRDGWPKAKGWTGGG